MPIIAKSRADIYWLSVDLPTGGTYSIYRGDNIGGAVDYESPMNTRPIPAWPAGADQWGDGLGADGDGGDGFGEGGLGDGLGADGFGLDGFSGDFRQWTTPRLLDGMYLMAVVAADAAGNVDAESARTTTQVILAGIPLPPSDLAGDTYNDSTDTLRLAFTFSPDDG